MRSLLPGLLLLLSVARAAGAQQFELAISGQDYSCFILPIVTDLTWIFFPDPPQPDMARDAPLQLEDIGPIAAAPGGGMYGLISNSAIMRIAPDGTVTPFFGGISGGHAFAIAATAAGRVYMSLWMGGAPHLAVISPAGAQEAIHPMPGANVGAQSLAVANDGCTVYYATPSGIRRINGCTGAPLPDFVTLAEVNDVEALPGGELLVAAANDVLLYSPTGALVRTVASLDDYGYGVGGEIEEATVVNGILWIAVSEACAMRVLRVSFDTGVEVRQRLDVDLVTGTGLIVSPSSHASVPAAGTVALMLFALALAAAGSLVLRLR